MRMRNTIEKLLPGNDGVIAVIAVSVLAGQEIRDRFRSTGNFQADSSANSRFDSWAAGWAITREHPMTGVGIRNSPMYVHHYGADKRGRTVHSQYIQIAADSGIPAMLIYIGMLGVAIVHTRRCRTFCAAYLDNHADDHPNRTPDEDLSQMVHVAFGYEASLLIFAFDSIFLSLEVFELPWLMLVVAGVMPHALMAHARSVGAVATDTPRPPPHRRRPRSGSTWRGPVPHAPLPLSTDR